MMDLLDTKLYAMIGEDGFRRLVAAFYRRVPTDDILGPLYPKDDLHGAEERLRLFLIQRFGGPSTYSEQRGHPRLRMRHAPFAIGPDERDRWLAHMRAALDELAPAPEVRAKFEEYFGFAAESMRNRD
jgi:hemoglobin